MRRQLALGSEPSNQAKREWCPHPQPLPAAHPLNLETRLGRNISLADIPLACELKTTVLKVLQGQFVQNGESPILQKQLFHG